MIADTIWRPTLVARMMTLVAACCRHAAAEHRRGAERIEGRVGRRTSAIGAAVLNNDLSELRASRTTKCIDRDGRAVELASQRHS